MARCPVLASFSPAHRLPQPQENHELRQDPQAAYAAVPEAGRSARSQQDLDVEDLVLGPAAEPARQS